MSKYLRFFFILLTVLYCHLGYSQAVNSDSLVPYRVGNKWGYSDMRGKILIRTQYDDALFFNKNCAIVKKDQLFYLINSKNKRMTKGLTGIDWDWNCAGFLCFNVIDNDKKYCLDTMGKKIKDCGCDDEKVDRAHNNSDGKLVGYVTLNNQFFAYFLNDSTKKLYGNKLTQIEDYGLFENYYLVTTGNSKGLVFNDGKTIKKIFDTDYQSIDHFSIYDFSTYEELEVFFILKKDNLAAFASASEILIPLKYKEIHWTWHNKLLKVKLENRKMGYVNFNGFEYFKD